MSSPDAERAGFAAFLFVVAVFMFVFFFAGLTAERNKWTNANCHACGAPLVIQPVFDPTPTEGTK